MIEKKGIIAMCFFFIFLLMPYFYIWPQDNNDSAKCNVWGYFQPQLDTKTNAFSISKARAFAQGYLKKFSYLVEVEARSGNPLVKAQIAYKLFENFQIIFGQHSNCFKFYVPPPHKKLTVNYPIIKFVPKEQKDDLGITFKGKISLLEYNLSILNGPGANIRDDNSDKDTVIWAKITPWKWVFINVCWQGGWQNNPDRYYRSGQWFQAQFQFCGFTIRPTWVKRNDMQDEGWFVLALRQLNSEDKLLLQYLKDKERRELTIGAIIKTKNESIHILPNLVLQRRVDGEFNLEAYLMLQIDLNKPKSNKREEDLKQRN